MKRASRLQSATAGIFETLEPRRHLSAARSAEPVALTAGNPVANRATTAWTQKAPVPGRTFFGLDMISTTEGWGVTEYGGIYHTTDAGLNWKSQNSGTNQQLRAVQFLDSQRGWAVGNAALYTTDGGVTWNKATGNQGTMMSVNFVDASVGFAGVDNGVLKTTDGGRTWSRAAAGSAYPSTLLRATDFVDRNRGWSTTLDGEIIATTDGGVTWSRQNIDAPWFGTGSIDFVNANDGWAASGTAVYRTTNGGATWTQQSVPAASALATIKFLDTQTGWAVGSEGNIIHTTNGGATWTRQQGGTNVSRQFFYPLWAIDFVDANHAVTVGANGVTYNTTNGGATWSDVQQGSGRDTYRLVQTDPNHIFGYSQDGFLIRSTDGGNRWQKIAVSPDPNQSYDINGITFTDNLNGWMVAKEIGGPVFNPIQRTTDGGLTWHAVASQPPATLYTDVDTVDNQNVVLTPGDRTFRYSNNAGNSWNTGTITNALPEEGLVYTDVDMVTANVGYAVGNIPIAGTMGSVAKTIDGGKTWQVVLRQDNITTYFPQVSFSDVNNGYATGFNGELYRTSNGGATWTTQQTNSGMDVLYGVHTVSATVAWAAGADNADTTGGSIVRTLDGGRTWTTEHLNSRRQLTSIVALDATTAFASGWYDVESDTGGIFQRSRGTVKPSPTSLTPSSGAIFSKARIQPAKSFDVRKDFASEFDSLLSASL